MITEEEATLEVVRMARRMALMYHYVSVVLQEKLGKDLAKSVLKEAIWRYGTECGSSVRKGVQEMGLPLTVDNYGKVRDLPKYGWQLGDAPSGQHPPVTYCPLAAVWLEKGSQEFGRIYCYVDQAKYKAYNGVRCIHSKNILEGDGYCEFLFMEEEPK